MTQHYRTRVTPWSQTQIDSVNKTIFGIFSETFGKCPDHAGKELLIGQVAKSVEITVAGIATDKVYVGGEIKLSATELTHRDYI